jgi:D-sedoheptulose 7-phosphate isomerase
MEDSALLEMAERAAREISRALRAGGKILFAGNGGSAADAQHLSAELSGRFAYDRPPLFAEALHVNTSYLTAVANDYSFDEVYARLVHAFGRQGDVLVALSTSGNSPNVVRAVEAARGIGMVSVGMTGRTGGRMRDLCEILVAIPSDETARIQEVHMLIGHAICGIVEREMFPHAHGPSVAPR